MKILVHSIYFPPRIGGLETHVLTLCQELIRQGHEVTVVSSNTDHSPQYEVFQNVSVYRYFCPFKNFLGWLLTIFLSIPKFIHLAKDCVIIHVHTFPSVVPAFFARLVYRRKKIVATFHTSHFVRLSQKKKWKPILKFLLKQPDLLLTPSEIIKELSIKILPSIKVKSMVNAVDTYNFKITDPKIKKKSSEEKFLFYIGRLYDVKGVHFAIDALKIVREKHNAHFFIAGKGPEEEKLHQQTEKLGLQDYVHFFGNIANTELPSYYCSADVVVLPSKMEATSITALEAMACGRVVVASDVGGLPQIVRPEYGRLAQPQNPQDLAEKISSLFELPQEELKAMGEKAREKVVNTWSVTHLTHKIEDLYQDILK